MWALGPLGWPPEQALDADVNAILLGMEGLRQFHNPPPETRKPVSAEKLAAATKAHNARRKKR